MLRFRTNERTTNNCSAATEDISLDQNKKRVSQGFILSPIIFKTNSEILFTKVLPNLAFGVPFMLITDEGRQRLIATVVVASDEFVMTLNCKKTHFLVISNTYTGGTSLFANFLRKSGSRENTFNRMRRIFSVYGFFGVWYIFIVTLKQRTLMVVNFNLYTTQE